ncbi:MAG TPA: hypothetical protein GX522_07845 [Firmicutes bacterium]|jgi:hypothetical protein|nr:hypothetical protein [Bacillota bacterium]
MQKMKIWGILALAVMLTVSAFAQDLNFGGYVENKSKWDKENGLRSQNDVKLEMGLSAGGGDRLKAVVQIEPWKLTGSDVFGTPDNLVKNLNLAINKMYIESKGSYWNGGPELTTRLGDLDIKYNPWIAEASREGVSVDDLELYGAKLGGFYIWDNADNTPFQAQGLKASGTVGPVDGALTVVTGKDNETSFAVDAIYSPLDNLALKSVFAASVYDQNVESMKKAFKLDGAMQVSEKTLVDFGYRTVDAEFDPTYRSHAKDQWGNPINPVDLYKGQSGVNLGVNTKVENVNLGASYDQPTALAKFGANTEISGTRYAAGTELNVGSFDTISMKKTTASVERDFALEQTNLTGRYDFTAEKDKAAKHKISAKAVTNLVETLPNLGLGASVEFEGMGENPVGEVNANYTAPNGLTLKGAYNTQKGASAEAGVKVTF